MIRTRRPVRKGGTPLGAFPATVSPDPSALLLELCRVAVQFLSPVCQQGGSAPNRIEGYHLAGGPRRADGAA
jgi:hypothetical protein